MDVSNIGCILYTPLNQNRMHPNHQKYSKILSALNKASENIKNNLLENKDIEDNPDVEQIVMDAYDSLDRAYRIVLHMNVDTDNIIRGDE